MAVGMLMLFIGSPLMSFGTIHAPLEYYVDFVELECVVVAFNVTTVVRSAIDDDDEPTRYYLPIAGVLLPAAETEQVFAAIAVNEKLALRTSATESDALQTVFGNLTVNTMVPCGAPADRLAHLFDDRPVEQRDTVVLYFDKRTVDEMSAPLYAMMIAGGTLMAVGVVLAAVMLAVALRCIRERRKYDCDC
jgi:hypothetical protein